MLDTVAIKIIYPDFKVTRPDLFSPDLKIRMTDKIPAGYTPKSLFRKYTQNFTDAANGHTTKLTAYRRFEDEKLNHRLHIEVSVPKMLFGNNLQELGEANFGAVVSRLQRILSFNMGIEVSEETIENSIVTKAHFGKNVPLPYPRTSIDAILELQKGDLGKAFEVNHREYKNNGEALYFYTKTRNLIFYDKVKDYQKPKSQATDKEKTSKEKEIVALGLLRHKEILRFEIRLVGQQSVNSFITKATGKRTERITLRELFNEALCRDAVLYAWKDLTKRPANQLAFKLSVSPEDVLNTLMEQARDRKSNVHGLNRVLIHFGLFQLINQLGAHYVRNKFEKVWSDKTCGKRLNDKIKESALSLKDIPNAEIVGLIDTALNKFEKYTFDY